MKNFGLIVMLITFLCLFFLNLTEYFNIFYIESIGVPISVQKIKQLKYSLCMDKIEYSQNICYSKNNGSFNLNRDKNTKIYINKYYPEICKYESAKNELIYISFLGIISTVIILKIIYNSEIIAIARQYPCPKGCLESLNKISNT